MAPRVSVNQVAAQPPPEKPTQTFRHMLTMQSRYVRLWPWLIRRPLGLCDTTAEIEQQFLRGRDPD